MLQRRYLSLIETPCGFSEHLLTLLGERLGNKPEILRHGIIMFDEMKTRKNLRLDSKTLKYTGLVDFGDQKECGNINEIADHGLVFAFHSLMDDCTQPIAVFASQGPTRGVTLAKLIVQCIAVLEKFGAKIHGVVSDGASTNRKFWTEVGCSGKMNCLKNSFPHPTIDDREVYLFSDTPHLIKCIRNRLFDYGELRVLILLNVNCDKCSLIFLTYIIFFCRLIQNQVPLSGNIL